MVLTKLVKREVKAFLKNPAFAISLIVIVLVYAMIGGVMRTGMEEAAKTLRETGIGLVVEGPEEDQQFVKALVSLLNSTVLTGAYVEIYESIDEALRHTDICAIIPSGFTKNVTSGSGMLFIKGIVRLDDLAVFRAQAKIETLNVIAGSIKATLPMATKIVYGKTQYSEVDVKVATEVIFYGKVVNAGSLLALLSTTTFLPVIAAIVIGSNAGYAAQLVAFEKVEKAFEMLLSQPIRRSLIVLAKIIGASIATMVFAVVYVISLIVLFTGTMPRGISFSELSETIQYNELSAQLGVNLGFTVITALVVSVVLGLLSSGSLGIVLGALSPDERTAGILLTPIMLLYMGAGFAFTFLGVELSAIHAIVSGITVVSMPTVYILSIIANEPIYAVVSIISASATCLLLILLAIIIFNRDIVILGIRLRERRET